VEHDKWRENMGENGESTEEQVYRMDVLIEALEGDNNK